ncbi:hypothetical protein [Burkholderia sp. AU16741]|uniref:hypothetical protein n=1 Tax=Burkholderia sp. AU16741 TaxID=2015347 RepID=UPI0015C5F42D|nr:hypothetical protein [Burkholderia sp. AU16741]
MGISTLAASGTWRSRAEHRAGRRDRHSDRRRVRDTVVRMARDGIAAPAVMIGHGGRPIDFRRELHPY